jgi:hypothetical protein
VGVAKLQALKEPEMISKRRAKELDQYFYTDHMARTKTSGFNLIVGSVALVLCAEHKISHLVSLTVAAIAMVAVVMLRLRLYEADNMRGLSRSPESPVELSNSAKLATAFSPDRRGFIASAPLGIAAMFGLIIVLPDTTEAQAIHRRLRVLVGDGDISAAQKLAHQAVRSGIPLEPDVLGLVGTVIPLDKVGNLVLPDMSSMYLNPPGNRAAILAGQGQVLSIRLPILHVPKGTFRLGGTLAPGWVSFTGEGAALTYLRIDSEAASRSPLFRFKSGMKADVIITSLTVLSVRPEHGNKFLEVEPGASKVAVFDVGLKGLSQTLDRVLWNRVRFEDCSVACMGQQLTLSDVQFISCSFTFSPDVPPWITKNLTMSNGMPVSVNWG